MLRYIVMSQLCSRRHSYYIQQMGSQIIHKTKVEGKLKTPFIAHTDCSTLYVMHGREPKELLWIFLYTSMRELQLFNRVGAC